MSQSPLSRAIRELERDLGVVLFVRTTRRVELTPAGSLQLERARRALAEIDGAIADARRSAHPEEGVLAVGYGPFNGTAVARIVEVFAAEHPELSMRLQEEVTPEALRRVGTHELAAAVVMESPAAAQRQGVRVDTLKDEPLLAALPESHRYAGDEQISVGALVAERVLLPREPAGQMFNAWLGALVPGARIRTRADDHERQCALGSTHASRGKRRGRSRRGRRLDPRDAGRCDDSVRSAVDLSDGLGVELATD